VTPHARITWEEIQRLAELPKSAVVVYLAHSFFANAEGSNWHSQERIAKELGMSRRQVIRAEQALSSLIRTNPRGRGRLVTLASRVTLTGDISGTTGDKDVTLTGDIPVTLTNKENQEPPVVPLALSAIEIWDATASRLDDLRTVGLMPGTLIVQRVQQTLLEIGIGGLGVWRKGIVALDAAGVAVRARIRVHTIRAFCSTSKGRPDLGPWVIRLAEEDLAGWAPCGNVDEPDPMEIARGVMADIGDMMSGAALVDYIAELVAERCPSADARKIADEVARG
jgi:hypothetical protein